MCPLEQHTKLFKASHSITNGKQRLTWLQLDGGRRTVWRVIYPLLSRVFTSKPILKLILIPCTSNWLRPDKFFIFLQVASLFKDPNSNLLTILTICNYITQFYTILYYFYTIHNKIILWNRSLLLFTVIERYKCPIFYRWKTAHFQTSILFYCSTKIT